MGCRGNDQFLAFFEISARGQIVRLGYLRSKNVVPSGYGGKRLTLFHFVPPPANPLFGGDRRDFREESLRRSFGQLKNKVRVGGSYQTQQFRFQGARCVK